MDSYKIGSYDNKCKIFVFNCPSYHLQTILLLVEKLRPNLAEFIRV